MERENTIFDFFAQIFFIFGVTVVCLMVIVMIFGAQGDGISTIFAYANKAISLATLAQYFGMSILITILRWLFFSDLLIKNWKLVARVSAMFVCIVVMIAVFTMAFGWFPVNNFLAWTMFFGSFLLCSIVSVCLSVLKERKENEKMQNMLERLKEGEI